MGIFHKTLADAEEAIRGGNFENAYKIIDKHQADNLGLGSTMSMLITLRKKYDEQLEDAKQCTNKSNRGEAIKCMQRAKVLLNVIEQQVKFLAKEVKSEE